MKAYFLCLILSLCACAHAQEKTGPAPAVKTGIDVLEENGFRELKGKRIGLITNHTGKDSQGRGTAEVLSRAPGVTLAAIFSPEHGFNGTSEESKISNAVMHVEGRDIPVHSLFSGGIKEMRPNPNDLLGLDALVFDIQDIGARFYTYLAAMGMALEEAKKAGIEFIVLDRPNPINGLTMEGPVLDDLSLRKAAPTAYFPVPVRHGMTAGEIALLHNAEVKSPKLKIVQLKNWSRKMWYDQTGLPWIAPSPNMPDLEAATLYPGIAIFEAGNVSVGRGTPIPFRWIGAPWMESEEVASLMNAALLEGIEFSAQDYTPTKSVYEGELCRGVRMKITDRERLRPLAVFLKFNEILTRLHPKDLEWRWDEVKRMAGTEEFHRIMERGGDPEKLMSLFDRGPEDFAKIRKPYLLY